MTLRVFTYVIDHDVGFAPNPFHGVCTLAACKPQIRKTANIGDYVIGTGSKPSGRLGHLIYWMQISEIVTFDEYWADPRFRRKRARMNGSLMQQHGDNIYRRDPASGSWLQSNSFHSRDDGTPCPRNLARDTGLTDRVLIGSAFAYWGAGGPKIPDCLSEFIHSTQGHRCRYPHDRVAALVDWLTGLPRPEKLGRPTHWPTP